MNETKKEIETEENRDKGEEVDKSLSVEENINADEDMDIAILPNDNGKGFKHSFYVHSDFIRFIIGKQGKTIKDLEKKTNTKLLILKNSVDADIEISGDDEKQIKLAKQEVNAIMKYAKPNIRINHMISLPITTEEVVRNFNLFKADVMTNCIKDNCAVTEELFQKPSKLHLTIAVLKFLEKDDKDLAIEALKYCKENVIDPILDDCGSILVELKGIGCMDNHPDKAKVLFAKVLDETGNLQKMGQRIFEHFSKLESFSARRWKKENNTVFFHATVMNVAFKNKKLKKNDKLVRSFDATNIIKAHADTYFGKVPISSIHLSILGTATDDSYYKPLLSIDLSKP